MMWVQGKLTFSIFTMSKILLLFLCALMLLLEPMAAVAAPREATATEATAGVLSRIGHRPNYKLGAFRRWALWRKAKKKRASKGLPSIKVGKPVRVNK
jgi:hypothetical protein